MTVSENELILQCLRNNRKAQLAMYEKKFGFLMSIAKRYYRHREDCVLHVNTAFLKILDHLKEFNGTGSFDAWCSRIMNRVLIDEWRKNRRYTEHHHFDEHLESRNDFDEATYNTAQKEMDEEELLEMLLQLPQTTRHVFNLFAIEGYAHAEIAGQMGMSEGTSRWHVNEARTALKKLVLKKMNIVPLRKTA